MHHLILEKSESCEKEELLCHLINTLIYNYTTPLIEENTISHVEINEICNYLQKNYADTIVLDNLSHIFNINKYYLIRMFTKTVGITPYQYLSTIRVNNGKHLLEIGVPPLDAALISGFTDQSYFTRFFKNYIGLTPSAYQKYYNTK